MGKLWPHQRHALIEVWNKIQQLQSKICVTSPTGGGKTRLMCELIEEAVYTGLKVALYTNRVMLTEQSSKVLGSENISHGIRAAGFLPDQLKGVQICSIMTEHRRLQTKADWELHEANLVLVDEAHAQKAKIATEIFTKHIDSGASLIGFTATPIGIGHLYNELVTAGCNSELRKCGAHVPCITYGPDEPDLRHIRKDVTGEYMIGDMRKHIHTQKLFGRVLESWEKLNPEGMPTILFAPGVAESKWFVDQFTEAGHSAAHIDGRNIYVDGKVHTSTQALRDELLERSRDGDIKILCNRFVLREGIDAPWLSHCIMATPFGTTTSYLQAGGRLLRSCRGLFKVVLQDHGGNWFRHGSLNEDRMWDLDDGEVAISEARKKKEKQPIQCPACGFIRNHGPVCPACGERYTGRLRNVLMEDGSLSRMEETERKPRETRNYAITKEEKAWVKCLWAGMKNNRSLKQVAADYRRRTGKKPNKSDIYCMPDIDSENWELRANEYMPRVTKWLGQVEEGPEAD